jgi:arylsulfatase A-like enzyme
MRPASVSNAGVFTEAIGLGCSVGLLHAIAETTLLGLNGIRPSAVDLAIFVSVYCAAGVPLAALVALAALTPPFRAMREAVNGPLTFRRALWGILISAYVLVFLRIVYYWSGWGSLLWLLAAAPALGIAGLAVYRRGQRALTPLCAAALVAATLCALELVRADWGHQPASTVVFAIRLLIPIGVCLAALLAVYQTTSRDRPFEPLTRGAGMLALLVAAWAGFWITLDSGVSLGRFFDAAPPAANPARPNFLLIVLDTVRADHLDLFGYERQTMPNLRRFAEQSQVANRMFTTGSWTLASHGSMFTGLYPSAHRAHHLFVHDKAQNTVAYPLREDVPTLAEFFDSLGYQTAGIVSNFAALSGFGMGRGFEHYDTAPGGAFLATRILWLYRAGLGNWSPGVALQAWLPGAVQARSRLFSLKEPLYRRAWEINVRARQWLERRASRPFFLFLNYLDAHSPYLPLPEDDERFAKRPPGEEWFAFPVLRFLGSQRGAESFTAEEVEFLKAQYDAELVSLDRELGRLFDFLRESALLENTVVFITTDHGESFFEHGFPDHGNSLYQHEIGGFLVIKTPPSLSPVQVSPLMQFVDFLPTAAAILNEPVPAPVQGSAWGNGRDYALSEMFCKGCGREMLESTTWPDVLKDELIAVIRGNTKLIRSMRNPDTVYDLSTDPAESKPLADPDPEFVRRAEEIIAERNRRLVEGLSARPEDKILLEKLRSLGYVQ